MLALFFFFLRFIYLFERQRGEVRVEVEGEGERISSPAEHRVQSRAPSQNPEIMA